MRYRELADAIRRGAKMRPRGFGAFPAQLESGTSCALLAAIEGLYGWPKSYGHLAHLRPYDLPMAKEIVTRNDARGMTREQIADWLDSLEEPGESDSDWAKRKVAEVTRVKEAA